MLFLFPACGCVASLLCNVNGSFVYLCNVDLEHIMALVMPEFAWRLALLLVQHGSFLSHAVFINFEVHVMTKSGARALAKKIGPQLMSGIDLYISRINILSVLVPLMYVPLFFERIEG